MPSDTDGEKRKGLEDDSRAGFSLRPPLRPQAAGGGAHSSQAARAMTAASPPASRSPLAERFCVLSTPPLPPAFTAAPLHSSHRSALAPLPRKNSIRLKPGPLSSRVQPKRTCRTL